jgi:multidrug efflux pump
LQIYTGSLYVNDFNLFGRTWQVVVQAEAETRDQPEDLPRLAVRSSRGSMVPLGSLAGQRPITGPLVLTRYNMYPAASINGMAAPGVSSGETIALMERLADLELPRDMRYEWTDMSYLELLAGNTAMLIFCFAVIMVFLVLAAQYESWSLPLAVILVVPMCLLSAITAVNIAHMDINIFTQVGFVVLVGLASKNAILIVEFAKQMRLQGHPRRTATLEACKLRLRPIIMTSFAFILGVVPLIVSTGAGAEMRRTLGTAVFGGMLGVTLFGIVLTPVFFFTIDWLGETHLFRMPWVRRIGSLALDVFALRGVRKAGRFVVKRMAPRERVGEPGMLTPGEGPCAPGAYAPASPGLNERDQQEVS